VLIFLFLIIFKLIWLDQCWLWAVLSNSFVLFLDLSQTFHKELGCWHGFHLTAWVKIILKLKFLVLYNDLSFLLLLGYHFVRQNVSAVAITWNEISNDEILSVSMILALVALWNLARLSLSDSSRDRAQTQHFNLRYWPQFHCYCTIIVPACETRHNFSTVDFFLNEISNIEILSLSTILTWVGSWKPGQGLILTIYTCLLQHTMSSFPLYI